MINKKLNFDDYMSIFQADVVEMFSAINTVIEKEFKFARIGEAKVKKEDKKLVSIKDLLEP